MASRLDGRSRYVALIVLGALAVAVALASGWWGTRQARDAIEQQVRVSQALAADERAATVRDAIRAATARLDLTMMNPVVTELTRADRRDQLQAALEAAVRTTPVIGVEVVDPDGTVLARSGSRPARPVDTTPVFRSSADRSDAYMTLGAPIRHEGITVGWVYQEQSLRELSPHLASPFTAFAGTGSLVRRDGTIVLTTEPRDGAREEAPELQALLASGETGAGSYYSLTLGSDRVVAVHPIEGTDMAFVVRADIGSTSRPAAALVTRFAGLFVVTFVALGVLLGVASALLVSLRRDLVRAREAAAALARTDALTEVGNRRSLDLVLLDLEMSDEIVGIVLVDVDDLKSLNDTCGHAVGDEALQRIASTISAVVREGDLVCRIGGDEFVVVLTDRGSARAEAVARSIEDAVEAITTEPFDGLSVSTGIDVCRGRDLHYGLNRADDLLYKAKRVKRQDRIDLDRTPTTGSF